LFVKSFDMASNSVRKPSAPRLVIIAVKRSRFAVGVCGRNVADASAALLAIPTTSVMSRCMSASGAVHRVYPTTTAAANATVVKPTTANLRPGPSSSVPTVTPSRRNSTPLITTPWTISRQSTEHTDTHHNGHASAIPR
jgi:hypothetical protein